MATFDVKAYKIRIEPHPNADAIELAVIGGYRSIVRKGQYKDDDLVLYIPEAAVLPEWILKKLDFWDEENGIGRLNGPKGNRVKAIRLRKVMSQGIVFPLEFRKDVLDTVTNTTSDDWVLPMGEVGAGFLIKEDTDYAPLMKITKYEPPIPVHMSGEVFNAFGMTVKYDIENFKKWPDVLIEGEDVVMTEKLHGCISPRTLVMLPNGEELPIEDIIADDNITTVLSYDVETSTFKPKTITSKFRRANIENKKWMKLTMENGRSLNITEDHPVFSNDRNDYVKAKNILPNEDIKSPI